LELDDNFKRLVRELGEAINNALASSDDVTEVLTRIRSAGYDLVLVLELTIGFNRRANQQADDRQDIVSERISPVEVKFNSEDAEFLRALKINLEREP
jgi:hypothetical protein